MEGGKLVMRGSDFDYYNAVTQGVYAGRSDAQHMVMDLIEFSGLRARILDVSDRIHGCSRESSEGRLIWFIAHLMELFTIRYKDVAQTARWVNNDYLSLSWDTYTHFSATSDVGTRVPLRFPKLTEYISVVPEEWLLHPFVANPVEEIVIDHVGEEKKEEKLEQIIVCVGEEVQLSAAPDVGVVFECQDDDAIKLEEKQISGFLNAVFSIDIDRPTIVACYGDPDGSYELELERIGAERLEQELTECCLVIDDKDRANFIQYDFVDVFDRFGPDCSRILWAVCGVSPRRLINRFMGLDRITQFLKRGHCILSYLGWCFKFDKSAQVRASVPDGPENFSIVIYRSLSGYADGYPIPYYAVKDYTKDVFRMHRRYSYRDSEFALSLRSLLRALSWARRLGGIEDVRFLYSLLYGMCIERKFVYFSKRQVLRITLCQDRYGPGWKDGQVLCVDYVVP